MTVKAIFKKYMMGDNIVTPIITEYRSKKFNNCTLLLELSEGRSMDGGTNYGTTTLILKNNIVQQIDLGFFCKSEKEREEYINNLTQQDIDEAYRFGKKIEVI